MKILIVEDDETVRTSMAAHFEDKGFAVELAETAEEAMAIARNQQPDAAIIDLRLPGMDGESLIRKLCEHLPHTVYIIYTGSMEFQLPEDIKAMAAVSDKVFIKPIRDLNLISNEVERLLESKS